MNVLFVNYGDFTTNSLNHIGPFANRLCAIGHSCAVSVPFGKDSLRVVPSPVFIPVTFEEALERPRLFPDGRGADIIHAWTPRETVRRFVLAYQSRWTAHLVVHLEDNERFLIESYTARTIEELLSMAEEERKKLLVDSLSHPLRLENLLELADGATVITERLREHVPPGPRLLDLPPGINHELYHPGPPDSGLRAELKLPEGKKLIVYTGSTSFANEAEMRDLYTAVALLNARGTPTHLVRTGFTAPHFLAALPDHVRAHSTDLGFVDKALLPRLLALSDVLVQPGRAGGFNDFRLPSKIPEFLASGRPVILPATNIASHLRDGEDALFLQQGSAEEIVALCERVFTDSVLARRLALKGAAAARRLFDLDTNTRRLLDFYTEVARAPRRAAWNRLGNHGASDIALRLDLALKAQLPDAISWTRFIAQIADLERELSALTREHESIKHSHQLTQQHANNLQGLLNIAHLDVEAARINARNLEALLSTARLEGEAAHARARNLEELNRAHADAAQQSAAAAQRTAAATAQALADLRSRFQTLDETLRASEHARAILQQTVSIRENKIARMQSSFSWTVTAPLRALRRAFSGGKIRIDPPAKARAPADAPPEPAPQPCTFAIDHPASWTDVHARRFTVRGWILHPSGAPIAGVRARVRENEYSGRAGLRRVDLPLAMPHRKDAGTSGFEIPLRLADSTGEVRLEALRSAGVWEEFARFRYDVAPDAGENPPEPYALWMRRREDFSPPAGRKRRELADTWAVRPRISILMPVHNTPERWLRKAIESVRAQDYTSWELCIANDASTLAHVRPVLDECARLDPRIKVIHRDTNGHISAASNSALALVTSEWVGLLDHDDELAPHALFEIASRIVAEPGEVDLYYSDEDKIDELGNRSSPYFKPDFLPDLFTAQNFTSHLSVYRTALIREVGGFRTGFEGSQDWDLALRVLARSRPERVRHIPEILYHWRAIPGSTALNLDQKDYPVEAARRALREFFDARGESAELLPVSGGHWRVRHPVPNPAPKVSIIIPTRDGVELLSRCVGSVLEKSTYPSYEIIVVDNGSTDPRALAYLRELASENPPHAQRQNARCRVIRDERAFNFSALNNAAVAQATGDFVCLLNNDMEVITADWLEEMVSHAARPNIGCVGAMLYYPDDTIQHAGVVLGIGGVAGHAFKRLPRGTEGVFNRARLVQNYSAVTAACLLVRKDIFEEVGGLDERELAVAFNDIDFCLKVRAAGYRNLWTPFAELYHHESASRGAEDTPEKHGRFRREIEIMKARWGPTLARDPAYNLHLTLEHEDFSIAASHGARLITPTPAEAVPA